jgi:hypothetical protein
MGKQQITCFVLSTNPTNQRQSVLHLGFFGNVGKIDIWDLERKSIHATSVGLIWPYLGEIFHSTSLAYWRIRRNNRGPDTIKVICSTASGGFW